MRRVGEDDEPNIVHSGAQQGTNLRKILIHGDKTKLLNFGGCFQFFVALMHFCKTWAIEDLNSQSTTNAPYCPTKLKTSC